MRYATGGPLLDCRLAPENAIAISLGGGSHDAAWARGGGFCASADLPVAVKVLHEEGEALCFGLSEVSEATLRRAYAVRPMAAIQSEPSL